MKRADNHRPVPHQCLSLPQRLNRQRRRKPYRALKPPIGGAAELPSQVRARGKVQVARLKITQWGGVSRTPDTHPRLNDDTHNLCHSKRH